MAEGRDKQQWNHTSSILALLANANRDAKKRNKPFLPSEFNPYSEKDEEDEVLPGTIEDLKVFLPANHPARKKQMKKIEERIQSNEKHSKNHNSNRANPRPSE